MKIERVYLIGVSINSFRYGDPAKILGIKMITLNGSTPRLCYHIEYEDDLEDYVPITEVSEGIYKISTLLEIISQNSNEKNTPSNSQ